MAFLHVLTLCIASSAGVAAASRTSVHRLDWLRWQANGTERQEQVDLRAEMREMQAQLSSIQDQLREVMRFLSTQQQQQQHNGRTPSSTSSNTSAQPTSTQVESGQPRDEQQQETTAATLAASAADAVEPWPGMAGANSSASWSSVVRDVLKKLWPKVELSYTDDYVEIETLFRLGKGIAMLGAGAFEDPSVMEDIDLVAEGLNLVVRGLTGRYVTPKMVDKRHLAVESLARIAERQDLPETCKKSVMVLMSLLWDFLDCRMTKREEEKSTVKPDGAKPFLCRRVEKVVTSHANKRIKNWMENAIRNRQQREQRS